MSRHIFSIIQTTSSKCCGAGGPAGTAPLGSQPGPELPSYGRASQFCVRSPAVRKLPPFVGKKVYAAAEVEAGRMYGLSGWRADVTAGIVAQTAFGPLYVGGSAGDDGHRRWFFKLGRVF